MRASQQPPGTRRSMVVWLIALVCTLAGGATARAADEDDAGPPALPTVTHARRTPHVRDPAAEFAKRLDLDSNQQASVQRLLTIRKAQIRRVWSDPAIAGGDRVGAVKAINDRTIAQVRALLSDEQRQKYFQPRPAGRPATGSQPSVEDWLNASRPKNAEPSAAR